MQTFKQTLIIALVLTSTILAVSACTEPGSEASNEPTTLQINDDTRFSFAPSADNEDRGSCFAEPCVPNVVGMCALAYNAEDAVFVTVIEVMGLYPPSTDGLPSDQCDYPFSTGSNKILARVEYSLMGKAYEENIFLYDQGFRRLGKDVVNQGDKLLVSYFTYSGHMMMIVGAKVIMDQVENRSNGDLGDSLIYDLPVEVGELRDQIGQVIGSNPKVDCSEQGYVDRDTMIIARLKEGCR